MQEPTDRKLTRRGLFATACMAGGTALLGATGLYRQNPQPEG